MTKKRAQVYYSGRVQGVGFRYTVREVAWGFEVTGWIRNLPDGRVELVAEGVPEEVEAFLEAIRSNHLGSYIRGAEVAWQPATGEFKDFRIAF